MLWAESAAPDGGCSSGQVRYHRREPEHTVLHQLVRENLASFLTEAAERYPSGELPPFIQGEFERYLSCGILEHGFARVRCSSCRDELLVAFSCKNRGVCPSCSARRMADTAAHLRDQVFPAVPLRQWVCTMPKRLRFLLAWKPKLISLALTLFLRALFAWQRRCARKQGIKGPLCGAVTFIQRFGSALNVNIHFHTLVPEGVFFQTDQGGIGFHALLPPSVSDLNKLLRRIILSLLKRLATQSALEEADAWMQTLAQSVSTATGPTSDQPAGGLCAFAEGFSLHAGVSVDKFDGEGRERLARYCARPCLSLERLSIDSDGQVLYSLKRTAPGAPAVLTLSPTEFLAKLAALIPPPRSHLVRYHGVFSPHCKQRRQIVPGPAPAESAESAPPAGAGSVDSAAVANPIDVPADSAAAPEVKKSRRSIYRIDWASLLKRVFALDVLRCERCGGRRKLIALITQTPVAKKILVHLGLPAKAPASWPARAPPDPVAGFSEHDGIDQIPSSWYS